MPTSQHAQPRQEAPSETKVLVAVVAEDEADRAAVSTAVAAHANLRVITSVPLAGAAASIAAHPVDAIIGFADRAEAWQRFKDLAARFPEKLSVLLVSDPDRFDASADGQVLNTVVAVAREELVEKAAGVTADAARAFDVRGTELNRSDAAERLKLAELSEREVEVLVHTANGLAIKQIAKALNRSYGTVATHRVNLMEKLGLHDRVALTRFAIRTGLIDA